MKRTKQAYFRQNPSLQQTKNSSGVTFVIGEDIDFDGRKRQYQLLQKEYLDEQVQQKKFTQASQKLTKQQFDQQLLHNTHHRGQLELEKNDRLHEVEKAHDNYNLNLASERKEKQRLQRERIIEEERRQLQLLNQRKVKKISLNQH